MRDAYAVRMRNACAAPMPRTNRRTYVRTHRIRSSKNLKIVTRVRAYANLEAATRTNRHEPRSNPHQKEYDPTVTTDAAPVVAHRQYIPEHVVPGKRLGRHIHHDPRSRAFPAELADVIRDVDHQAHGLPLDQGDVGSCTANALVGAQNCDPYYPLTYPGTRRAPLTERDALALYERETADEGQPYPTYDPGGTGLAVCKAARELGWLSRYAWAFSFDAALRALVLRPAIIGINWYDSFDQPNELGMVAISPDAYVRGGHEVAAVAIDTEHQLVGFWNSWGTSYGLGGRFWMSYSTVEELLAEGGDFKVPGAAVARVSEQ